MALIKCSECGKEISDKAKVCPHCGAENDIIYCPECGKQLSSKATICPNCGCPIKGNKNNENEETNALCLGGMVTGIVSWLIDFVGLVSATGLILSIIGLSKSSSVKNRTFAIIGIIVSSIELILKVIQLLRLIFL